ncbi:Mitochondrial outer membrane protein iml2 [Elasticomyces elasticus]|nr:Mitochondrial outer membrane protein iml2 [Elasticomyces elasticus]KAK5742884.1 Mitochondrial outer membrane protein iml2 [Elasticomyces elasticus]
MKRLGGLLGAKASLSTSKSLTALDEPAALQDAMASAAHIMNDGTMLLQARDSSTEHVLIKE